jgi:hypothetical protein
MKYQPILFLLALIFGETRGGDVIGSTICGPTDDCTPSKDIRQGRIVTVDAVLGTVTGTAWLISEDIFMTAGHMGEVTVDTRVHFTFNTADALDEDQYAVEVSSYHFSFVEGEEGNNWAVGRLLPNSSTGKLPGVAQSEKCTTPTSGCGWYNLGPVPSEATGNSVIITGYGIQSDGSVPQSTHTGKLLEILARSLSYNTDTMVRFITIVSMLYQCNHSTMILTTYGWLA